MQKMFGNENIKVSVSIMLQKVLQKVFGMLQKVFRNGI